ncbi:hypothetical protein H5410_035946 [Solanum commersonii]|uniref:Uncharacterized protein n=1 Tax=Solanum commersonii TaxID=4109 RepID=A0A9J5Y409_SOLCO|nr:hypothetical protein H5410_035946 [Solanum commersonii]
MLSFGDKVVLINKVLNSICSVLSTIQSSFEMSRKLTEASNELLGLKFIHIRKKGIEFDVEKTIFVKLSELENFFGLILCGTNTTKEGTSYSRMEKWFSHNYVI